MNIKEFPESTLPTKEPVDRSLLRDVKSDIEENNKGWTLDPDPGFILRDPIRQDGVGGFKHLPRKRGSLQGHRTEAYVDAFKEDSVPNLILSEAQ